MELATAIPVFKISSERLAREHYVDCLGFTIDWIYQQRNHPVYLQIRKDKLVLHLTEHEGDAEPGAVVMVHVSGIDQFYLELRSRLPAGKLVFVSHTEASTTLQIADPFGNQLRLTENKLN